VFFIKTFKSHYGGSIMLKYSIKFILFFYLNIYNCSASMMCEESEEITLPSRGATEDTTNDKSGKYTLRELRKFEIDDLVDKLKNTRDLAILSNANATREIPPRDNLVEESDSLALLILAAALRQTTFLKSLDIRGGNLELTDWWRLGCGLRGNNNINALRITHSFLNDDALHQFIKGISNDNSITELSIETFQSLQLPNNFASFLKIKSLNLWNCNFGQNDFDILSKIPSLKSLSLNSASLSKEAIEYLSHLDSLTFLSLDNCSIIGEMLYPLGQMSNLENLSLQSNELTVADLKSITPPLSNLRSLNLDKNKIDNIYELFEIFPNLSSLSLRENKIKDKDVFSLFNFIWENPLLDLKSLSIDGNDISQSSIIACRVLLDVRKKQLVFDFEHDKYSIYSENEVNVHHPYQILTSRDLKSLLTSNIMMLNPCFSKIFLKNASLNNKDAEVLGKMLKDNKNLTYLKLSYNNIGYEGVRYLAELTKDNSNLTSLRLINNPISEIEGLLLYNEIKKTNPSFKLILGRVLDDCNEQDIIEWYRRNVADQGNARAQCNLGFMYMNGQGVEQDYKEAFKCFEKVARQDNLRGQALLGTMYKEGWGVQQNTQEALQWIQKAADQGNALGQYCLALLYRDGEGVAASDVQAIAWLREAANQSSEDAQYTLGWMYENGRGVAKDLEEAAKWYKVSERGCPGYAVYSIGRMYEYGLNVEKDLHKALEWYRFAAGEKYARDMYHGPIKEKYNLILRHFESFNSSGASS